MKILQALLISCSIVFSSCSGKKEDNVIQYAFNFPVVIDSYQGERIDYNAKWQKMGNANPLYIGPRKDSICIDSNSFIYSNKLNRLRYSTYENDNTLYGRIPDSTNISLQIDTSQVISDTRMRYEYSKGNYILTILKSYPVFIINKTFKKLSIGYGNYLPISIEADSAGKWRTIETHYVYKCGMGLQNFILPPNQIVVTSIPIFKGSCRTKLRLSYHFWNNNIFSSEFWGYINPTQFKDEYGHYYN